MLGRASLCRAAPRSPGDVQDEETMNGPGTPAVPVEHWAPAQLVLARRRLTLVGPLSVARDAAGVVALQHVPGPVGPDRQGGPAGGGRAPGPFGRIWSVAPVPAAPGVFALVDAGTVRYVGHSPDLGRTFSRHGLGEVSRRGAADPVEAEHRRLHHLLVSAAVEGRTIDLYVLVSGLPAPRGIGWALRGLLRGRPVGERGVDAQGAGDPDPGRGADGVGGPDVGGGAAAGTTAAASPAARRPAELAEQIRAAALGSWQLP